MGPERAWVKHRSVNECRGTGGAAEGKTIVGTRGHVWGGWT